ncbi:MAG: antibiotic biosynthesis monooxygenase family protein [Bacteroidota bacterium]|jgi:quinol monooxygenase YgiN
MITRIVRLTFDETKLADFMQVFENSKLQIAAFEGCLGLQLMQDAAEKNVMYTLSYWESEAHLNKYRFSTLFKTTWAQTKILFANKPQAFSLELIEKVK